MRSFIGLLHLISGYLHKNKYNITRKTKTETKRNKINKNILTEQSKDTNACSPTAGANFGDSEANLTQRIGHEETKWRSATAGASLATTTIPEGDDAGGRRRPTSNGGADSEGDFKEISIDFEETSIDFKETSSGHGQC